MKSLWSDGEARSAVARWRRRGVGRQTALRIYSSRLLGGVPELVLHGGGNTSLKTRLRDATGAFVDVLRIKASGRDMAALEPRDLPALRLAPWRRLAGLEELSDAGMVDAQRRHKLDAAAPDPSVEFALHACLAHGFVDHTHADAILALTNQPDGAASAPRSSAPAPWSCPTPCRISPWPRRSAPTSTPRRRPRARSS